MNRMLFNVRFSMKDDYEKAAPMMKQQLILTVCYPGLLIGLGNTHDSGAGDEEIGVGFSFDYVTGQPYIPGSTVKGILRSHFKDHPEVVMSLCRQDRAWVRALEKEIFENADAFFDAVVYSGDPEGKLLGAEFITPHKSATENPVPIKLLKILPEVRFAFRFWLKDSPHMKGEQKLALFQQLLTLFGVGAKTNVGFGILREDETNGKPYPQPAAPVESAYRPRQNDHRDRPYQPRASIPTDPPNQELKVCAACGAKNRRFNGFTGRENPSWKTGDCFKCGRRLR